MKVVLALVIVAACGSSPAPDLSVETAGPHAVGTRALTLTDVARARTLTVQLWYPTDAAAPSTPFEQQEDVVRKVKKQTPFAPGRCT